MKQPMDDESGGETRRTFCVRACRTALGAALAGGLSGLLEGCGGPTAPSGTTVLPVLTGADTSGGVTVTIDSTSPLASVGGAALVQSPSRELLVARTGQSAFSALSAICTHVGCVITGFGSGVYVCPCHGSQFSTSGSVLSGPASSPLPQFTATLAGNVLTIAA